MDAIAAARVLALVGIEVRATAGDAGGGGGTAHVPAGSPKGGQFTFGHGSGGRKSTNHRPKKAAPPQSVPQAPATPRLVKEGDSGEDVRYAQYAMSLLGFKVAQDGKFGPETAAAVEQMQQRLGMKHPNGHITPALLHKMQDAVRLSPCVGGQRDLSLGAQWERRDDGFEDGDLDFDETAEAVLDALDEFERSAGGDWAERAHDVSKELRIPSGKGGGRWTKSPITSAIAHALEEWGKGNGPDDPFVFDGKPIDREPLRKAAVARGITLKRGASRDDIVAALKDDVRVKVGEAKAAKSPDAGKPVRFTLTGGAVDPAKVREVEVENKIRAAYRDVAARPFTPSSNVDLRQSGYVRMADLREAASDVPRAEFDATLRRITGQDQAGVAIPESAQWLLRPEDRAAALRMGNQDKHWLKLDDPSPRPVPKPDSKLRNLDVTVHTEPSGKISLWETSDSGERRRRVAVADDLAGLEQWATEHGETEVADWARKERGGAEAPPPTNAASTFRVINGREANAWGREHFTPLADLPPDQQDALRRYASAPGYDVNKLLRGGQLGPTNEKNARGILAGVDKVMASHQVPENVVVTRGVNLDALPGDPSTWAGHAFTEKGFLSTTLGEALPGKQSKYGVRMRLEVPAGTPGYWMRGTSEFSEERELLLGRGLDVEIQSAKWNPQAGKWDVRARIKPTEAPRGPDVPAKAPSAQDLLKQQDTPRLRRVATALGAQLPKGATTKPAIIAAILHDLEQSRIHHGADIESLTGRKLEGNAEMIQQALRDTEKATGPGDVAGAVAKIRDIRGTGATAEGAAIRELAGDPGLTAAKLREVADGLGIDVPEGMKAKTSIQMHIAHAVATGGIGEPKAAPTPPSTPDLAHLRTLDRETARDQLDLLKVDQLKPLLREQGLPVGGRKRELVDRLVDNLGGPTREGRPVIDPSKAAKGEAALGAAPIAMPDLDGGGARGFDTLPEPEQHALHYFRGEGYRQVTPALYRGKASPAVQERINYLDSVMERSPLENDVVTYRGVADVRKLVGARAASGDLTGAEFTDKAFLSTTTDQRQAEVFSRKGAKAAQTHPTVFRYVLPKGTKAVKLSGSKHESELLLQRGLRFRIVADHGVSAADGIHYLDLEVVKA